MKGATSPAAVQKNDPSKFRSQYYDKVGFTRGLDERKELEHLLSNDPVDLEKLKGFVLKCHSIPGSERFLVWKLLLDIVGTYSINRVKSWEWKIRSFRDCSLSIPYIKPNCKTRLETIGYLWQFTNRHKRVSPEDVENFKSIIQYLLTATRLEETAYYLTKRIVGILSGLNMNDYAAFYAKLLSMSGRKLHNHLDTIGAMVRGFPWHKAIENGFTGLFKSPHLCKIFDKVSAGAIKILVYLAVSLTEYHASNLMECNNYLDASLIFTKSPNEEDENDIIVSAISRWFREGRQMVAQPMYHSQTSASNATNNANSGATRDRNSNSDQLIAIPVIGDYESNLASTNNDVSMPCIAMSDIINIQSSNFDCQKE